MNISDAYIEIINICNLDCQTCYNRSGKPHKRKELAFGDIVRIADRLTVEFGCSRIILSGGEPTLHPDFDKILHHLLSLGITVGVVTNGTTNCQSLIEAYRSQAKLTLQVSLDGSCEEINAKTRGCGNFAKAENFLSQLKCTDKHPVLKMVISQNNLCDVEAYYRFALSSGCAPDFAFINGMGNASDTWDSLELTAQQKLSVLRTLDQLNLEYHQQNSLPLCTSSCPLSDPDSALFVLIKCDGSVMPCQTLYDDAYSLGNMLFDTSDLIEDKHLKLSAFAKQRETLDGKCLKCLARDHCRKGCIAQALMKKRDPASDDGECDFRKLQLLGYDIRQLVDLK